MSLEDEEIEKPDFPVDRITRDSKKRKRHRVATHKRKKRRRANRHKKKK